MESEPPKAEPCRLHGEGWRSRAASKPSKRAKSHGLFTRTRLANGLFLRYCRRATSKKHPMPSLTTHRTLVLAAVMAANFMIAIEATIVSTAMPQIVGQLGGLPLYSWVFAAFLLTQTATTVVFGKLADLVGRKTVMLVGIAIFLFGSILCGFAWSMPSLIVFRLVQGIGAGAVQPTAMTIVGDLYAVHERAKIQGWLASVWAVSAVLGPLAGGLIIQYFSWAWIFWMNLPIGALAAAGFWAYLHEKRARGRGRIDHLSAGIFTVAIAAIMADLTALSTSGRLEIGLTTLVAVVAVVLFVLQERRSPEPMISLELWGRRPIAAANGASLLAGHGDDWAHHVPAGVRAGRDAEIAADRRFRALRDGAGMANRSDGRRARRPQALRRARHAARGRCAHSVRRRSFFSSSTGRVRPSSLALARSSSASAWASPAAPRSS